MTKLVTSLPEEVWQEALRQNDGNAVFWHEFIDASSDKLMIALVLRGRPYTHLVLGYHFESDEDIDLECCRLNRLLGYNLVQMVSLKCAHLNREEGEPMFFSGSPPNCVITRGDYY